MDTKSVNEGGSDLDVPVWRRVAFTILSAALGLLMGFFLFGLPLLILGWFDSEDGGIHRFHSLSWGALIGLLAAVPALLQLRRPERKIAALQQIGVVFIAVILGYVFSRQFQLSGFLVLVGIFAVFASLHPARNEFFRLGRPIPALVGLAFVAAVPFFIYAFGQGQLQQTAGDPHAANDHYLDMVRVASAVPLVALVASLGGRGFRIPAWCAGLAAIFLGVASIVHPDQASSFGTTWGVAALAGGLLFIFVGERKARRRAADPRA